MAYLLKLSKWAQECHFSKGHEGKARICANAVELVEKYYKSFTAKKDY